MCRPRLHGFLRGHLFLHLSSIRLGSQGASQEYLLENREESLSKGQHSIWGTSRQPSKDSGKVSKNIGKDLQC